MSSKKKRDRSKYVRGGLGVRKKLSEESLRDSYRLNGVRSGSTVIRCLDRYGRWELGYTVGVIVRKTPSVVQIRWVDSPDEIHSYDAGDARYEVDRQRWRIMGPAQGNPLNPDDPLSRALTELRQSAMIAEPAYAGTPPTEENDVEMAERMSQAAKERAAAQKAVANGELKERETYTAKQIAARCGTDPKTMRKFFRSNNSTVEPVGQGGRYEFDAKDFPKIKREFDAWRKKATSRPTKPKPEPIDPAQVQEAAKAAADEEFSEEQIADAIQDQIDQEVAHFNSKIEEHRDELFGEDPGDPTPEDLAEIEDVELDLDDLDD